MSYFMSARFDDRDSADLALMRLRRSGVRFERAGLLVRGGERRVNAGVFSPFSVNMLNQPGASDPFFPPVGSRAVFPGGTLPTGEVILKLRVSREDLSRARDAVRSAGGRHVDVI